MIGRQAGCLASPTDARRHILGYAISDDLSERHFELARGGRWDKGESCATFKPFGPWVATTDEIADPQAPDLGLSVNGEVRQSSTTSAMTFDVDHLIWYVSQLMTLLTGDVTTTGTPQGVGSGFEPGKFLHSGDVVAVSIAGLGWQRHVFADDRHEETPS